MWEFECPKCCFFAVAASSQLSMLLLYKLTHRLYIWCCANTLTLNDRFVTSTVTHLMYTKPMWKSEWVNRSVLIRWYFDFDALFTMLCRLESTRIEYAINTNLNIFSTRFTILTQKYWFSVNFERFTLVFSTHFIGEFYVWILKQNKTKTHSFLFVRFRNANMVINIYFFVHVSLLQNLLYFARTLLLYFHCNGVFNASWH